MLWKQSPYRFIYQTYSDSHFALIVPVAATAVALKCLSKAGLVK